MTFRRFLIATLTLIGPVPATAQTAMYKPSIYKPAPADPARQAEAQRLVTLLYPAAAREQVEKKYISIVTEQMMELVRQDPASAAILQGDASTIVVQRFADRQKKLVTGDWEANWPQWLKAQADGYARRMTVDQMKATEAFAATPDGRAYLAAAAAAENDPVASDATGAIFALAINRTSAEVATMKRDLAGTRN